MRPSDRARAVLLAVRMLPWAVAVPVLKRRRPIRELVALLDARRERPWDPAREAVVRQASWWASRVQLRRFPDNCLERSLVAYRYLGLAGADPRMVLGIGGTRQEVTGHAWVTLDGRAVHDPPEAIERYRQIVEIGGS